MSASLAAFDRPRIGPTNAVCTFFLYFLYCIFLLEFDIVCAILLFATYQRAQSNLRSLMLHLEFIELNCVICGINSF